MSGLEPEQDHREAHEVVEVARRGVDDADAVEERGHGLARRGLARGARDADDEAALAPRGPRPTLAVERGEIAQRFGRVRDDVDRRGLLGLDQPRDDDAARAGRDGRLDVVVSVEPFAAERDEQAARRHAPRVGDDGDERAGAARTAHQGRGGDRDADLVDRERGAVVGDGRGHQLALSWTAAGWVQRTGAAAMASRASSRSSNANVVSPTIW